ncbi:hypothetical protein BC826DRAFT_289407 [Russula brevipes]|nr:hypothetical protein BC826DRAFT_289407 [Russula brevipes]
MLVAPYVVFLVFLVMILVVGSRRPDTVTRARRTFYCSMESRIVSLVSIGFTSLITFIAVGLGAMMSYQLYNFLRMVRQARPPQIRAIPLAIRLVIFMIYIFAALVTSLWSIRDHKTFIRDIYTSTFGVAYFLVFGTQRDIFRAWCFWRKDAIDTRTDTRTDERAARTMDDITTLYGDLSSPDSVPSLPETGATHEADPAFPSHLQPLTLP